MTPNIRYQDTPSIIHDEIVTPRAGRRGCRALPGDFSPHDRGDIAFFDPEIDFRNDLARNAKAGVTIYDVLALDDAHQVESRGARSKRRSKT